MLPALGQVLYGLADQIVAFCSHTLARTNSPTRSVSDAFCGGKSRTVPSIQARPRSCDRPRLVVRAQEPSPPAPAWSAPRRCLNLRADTSSATAMKRARRSSRTSEDRAPGKSLAAAPSTGEYAKHPARSICASRTKSSSVSNSASSFTRKSRNDVLVPRSPDRVPASAEAAPDSLAAGRTLHATKHVGVSVLERHVQVGQDESLRHQRHDVVDVRIGVDIVQSHPGPMRFGQLAEPFAQFQQASLDWRTIPESGPVLLVDAICARVLTDNEQFLDASLEELLRFAKNVTTGRDTRSPRIPGMMQKVQR